MARAPPPPPPPVRLYSYISMGELNYHTCLRPAGPALFVLSFVFDLNGKEVRHRNILVFRSLASFSSARHVDFRNYRSSDNKRIILIARVNFLAFLQRFACAQSRRNCINLRSRHRRLFPRSNISIKTVSAIDNLFLFPRRSTDSFTSIDTEITFLQD